MVEAVIYLRDEKWEATKINEKSIAYREEFEHSSESLECFDQAAADRISLIFHTWPIDAEDAEVEY